MSRGASSQLLAIGQGVGSSAAAAAAAAASAAGAGISSLLASRGRSTERQRPVTSVSGVGLRWCGCAWFRLVRPSQLQHWAVYHGVCRSDVFLSSTFSFFSLCQAGPPFLHTASSLWCCIPASCHNPAVYALVDWLES